MTKDEAIEEVCKLCNLGDLLDKLELSDKHFASIAEAIYDAAVDICQEHDISDEMYEKIVEGDFRGT